MPFTTLSGLNHKNFHSFQALSGPLITRMFIPFINSISFTIPIWHGLTGRGPIPPYPLSLLSPWEETLINEVQLRPSPTWPLLPYPRVSNAKHTHVKKKSLNTIQQDFNNASKKNNNTKWKSSQITPHASKQQRKPTQHKMQKLAWTSIEEVNTRAKYPTFIQEWWQQWRFEKSFSLSFFNPSLKVEIGWQTQIPSKIY